MRLHFVFLPTFRTHHKTKRESALVSREPHNTTTKKQNLSAFPLTGVTSCGWVCLGFFDCFTSSLCVCVCACFAFSILFFLFLAFIAFFFSFFFHLPKGCEEAAVQHTSLAVRRSKAWEVIITVCFLDSLLLCFALFLSIVLCCVGCVCVMWRCLMSVGNK
jgi:hypothetical protein